MRPQHAKGVRAGAISLLAFGRSELRFRMDSEMRTCVIARAAARFPPKAVRWGEKKNGGDVRV